MTERSYVSRLHTLQKCYAEPLRNFARRKESAILPSYEAKTLFGNIDAIIPVNEAFLDDLEEAGASHIGDVCLKHFRDLKAFDCYKFYYAKREEAQAIFEREMSRRNGSGFADFIDVRNKRNPFVGL
jgi:protein ECT2